MGLHLYASDCQSIQFAQSSFLCIYFALYKMNIFATSMINLPIFVEGLLLPLLALGVFIVYKKSKRKKRTFQAPPSHQLPS